MGLFDKKNCSVCGGKIGLLGNRKLEDGNLCKDCAAKLSPWFSERRHSTVADIEAQLAYREANKEKVAAFSATRTIGNSTKVILDEANRKFLVTKASNWKEANPDILDFADVTGCETEVHENRTEIKRKDAEGKEVSFNPPRYSYSYDFDMLIHVNNPYFDEISFRLNNSSVGSRTSPDYRNCDALAEEIRKALLNVRDSVREEVAAKNAPKTAVTCPFCGASTIPDANGCCEYCGGAVNA